MKERRQQCTVNGRENGSPVKPHVEACYKLMEYANQKFHERAKIPWGGHPPAGADPLVKDNGPVRSLLTKGALGKGLVKCQAIS